MNKVQTKSALVDGLVDDRCFVYLSIRINVLCSGGDCIGSLFFLCSGYDLNRNELETNFLYMWLLY